MNFDRRLRRVTFLAAVLGMLALGLGEMHPVYLSLIAVVAAVGWFREDREEHSLLGPFSLNLIILLSVAYAAVDYLWISESWILSLAHFLLIVQMAKLLLPKTDRDYAQVYLISLMNVAVAAIVTVNVFFAITFVLYSCTALLGLVLLHFHREVDGSRTMYLPAGSEAVRPTLSPDMRGVVSKRFYRMILTVMLVAWLCNGAFFLVAPRLQSGFLRFNPGSLLMRLSGFSENVRLGEIGRVLRDESPGMHVQLRDKDGNTLSGQHDLYWRGLTYQHYDGREWQAVDPGLKQTPMRTRNFPYFVDMLTSNRLDQIQWVEQSVILEPMGAQTLFALPGLLSMRCPALPTVNRNSMDETYRTAIQLTQVMRYTAFSDFSDPAHGLPSDLLPNKGLLTQERREAYLQLPTGLSPRVKDLARQIAPPGDNASLHERVRRIQEYLRSNFAYSLDLKPNPDVEPVEDFLFSRKSGHCEYFASSMVILVRCLNVPARLVSGFHGGEWNDLGEWYLVRQSDAHAWVEAYIEGEGWTRFDPTPAGGRDRAAATLALGSVGRWLDYLRTTWINHVVQYDAEQQSAILQHTRNASLRLRFAMADTLAFVVRSAKATFRVLTDVKRLTTTEGMLTAAGVLLVSTGFVLSMRWLLIKLGRRLRGAFVERRARRLRLANVAFYRELERMLKRRGFERGAGTTPREFIRFVATSWPDVRPALEELTNVFYDVRFGRAPLDPDQERRLRAMIASLRSAPISPPA